MSGSAMNSHMDSSGWPYEDNADHRAPARRQRRDGFPRPGFLAAPFSSATWRETLQAVLNLPVGIVTFSFAVILLSFGLGTVVTFIGLPVLAVTVLGCRGFGAMERARASALLGLDVAAPAPVRSSRPGLYGWIGAALRSGAGWRSVLYGLLMLPLGIVSFTMAVTLWYVAIACATYPLWEWVYPRFFGQPGLELYSNDNHSHYLTSVPEIAGLCGLGIVVFFVTPQVLRGLANIQRAMVRGLLSD
jgi:Putative sensor